MVSEVLLVNRKLSQLQYGQDAKSLDERCQGGMDLRTL